jgi:septal ring factor EnvC (AmiA/AmiB activator)
MIKATFDRAKIADLKAQINKLQQEKEQLHLLLHELIEAFCRTLGNSKSPRDHEAKFN